LGFGLASVPRADERQDGRQGLVACCDGKPRHADAAEFRALLARLRQPLRRRGKIDDQADHRAALVRQLEDTDATQLDQASEFGCRAHYEPAMRCLDVNAVIADQTREAERAARSGLNEFEREPRFA
jgi:hypothetical protein